MPLLPSGFVLYTQARDDSMAAHDSTYDIAMLVMAVIGALHDVCHFILWLTLHTTVWQSVVNRASHLWTLLTGVLRGAFEIVVGIIFRLPDTLKSWSRGMFAAAFGRLRNKKAGAQAAGVDTERGPVGDIGMMLIVGIGFGCRGRGMDLTGYLGEGGRRRPVGSTWSDGDED
ncbi:hypothetical protein VTO73DRAFT_7786 [Trametes versicolor]